MTRSSRRHTSRTRRTAVTAGTACIAAVAALGLVGCSGDRLGAALVIEDRVVTTDELQSAARDYLEIVPGADAGDAQLSILQRRIVSEIIDQVAQDVGVRVGAGAAPIHTPKGWLEIYHGNRRPSAPGEGGAYFGAAM